MQKLILTGLLFSFLLSACDGGRNIDVADRERRLGVPENQPAGGGVDPEIRIRDLSVSQARVFEADKKVIFNLSVSYVTKSDFKWHESLILVDLQNKLLYLNKTTGLDLIGDIECTSSGPNECQTFKINKTLLDFFPAITEPTLKNQPLEISAVSSAGEQELQQKINDIWTTVGSVSEISFITTHNFNIGSRSTPTTYLSFANWVNSDQPTWVNIYRNRTILIPFNDPIPGHRLLTVEDGNVDFEISFVATYLNMANGQTLIQQYRVENVQK